MFADRDEALKQLEEALLDEEETEEEEPEEEEEETEEDEEEAEDLPADTPPQNPRAMIAAVLLVTAGVLLFLAYLLAKQEGLL